MRTRFAIFALLAWTALAVLPLWAAETDCTTRDPSTMIKGRDGVYWLYGTGRGAQQFSSPDRLHWTNRGPVFASAPPWVASTVPGNKDNTVWAPDIRVFNGKYFLYYCYSTIGSKESGIGVATNQTLDPKGWVDQGLVIRTGADTNYNALDPCIFLDAAGKPWLSFGSYFSGIKLVSLDPVTGKRADPNGPVYNLATRPGVPGNAIEASYVYFHDGYYYLFVNWDGCCAGSRSTYNIRMGRSQTVTGPYLDKGGKDMEQGGGALFLGAVPDNGTGRPPDDETGPGHVGVLHDSDGDWLTTHYEWARDRKGANTLNVQRLAWDSDGWPRAVLDPGPYKLVSALSTHEVLDVAPNGASLQTWPFINRASQKWTLAYQGDGYYTIAGAVGGKALSVADDSTQPGGKVEIAPARKRTGQQWYLQQNDDGTYTLLTKASDKTVALDVGGCSLNDGTPVGDWKTNGLDCQKWSFHAR